MLSTTVLLLTLLTTLGFNSNTLAMLPPRRGSKFTSSINLSPTSASLLAGSIAGATGVVVSFPFDTIKTKTQAIANSATNEKQQSNINLIKSVFEEEGLTGFYSGVKPAAFGQFFIKAVAFSVNANALLYFSNGDMSLANTAGFVTLISAAALSGLAASFLVCPIERVKILMQAGDGSEENGLSVLFSIVRSEGLSNLFHKGLLATIAREVPSYALYFVVYSYMSELLIGWGPILQPLIAGGLSGMASWLPVYPIDVVKTGVQMSDRGAWDVASSLYVRQSKARREWAK